MMYLFCSNCKHIFTFCSIFIAWLGFWFGWVSIPFIIFFSSAVALLIVIPDVIRNKKNLSSQIPFGLSASGKMVSLGVLKDQTSMALHLFV